MKTFLLQIILASLVLVPVKNHANTDTLPGIRQNVSILFYNVENLYDPYDDSTTLDDEFTRDGAKKYTWGKFRVKLNNLAKTILTAGGWDTIAFIGMAEVENKYVLNKLIYETPLKQYGYRIIHQNSPDVRGVDVAALYHPKKLKVLSTHYFPVRFPQDTSIRTRDILYVKALLFHADTLHLFVNHWPSRRGGQEESAWRRYYVADLLRKLVDSIIIENEHRTTNILIMGDLNDDPADSSLVWHLGAGCSETDTTVLYNLMGIKNLKWTEGTIRYRGRWSTFDQFIVSRPLLDGSGALATSPAEAVICKFPFLLEEDPTWFGEKLSRTYAGPRFLGGFSDHLPVMVKIWSNGQTDQRTGQGNITTP